MESIDYLRAPILRWPLLVGACLLAAVVAVLLPIHSTARYPTDMWQTNARVGVIPSNPNNRLGGKIGPAQLEFFAGEPLVLKSAAKSAGVPYKASLNADLIVNKVRGDKGVFDIAVVQPVKHEAVLLTNGLVGALGQYMNEELADQYQAAITKDQRAIGNLKNALAALPSGSPASTTPSSSPITATTLPVITTTSLPPATTTTTIKHKKSKPTTSTSTSLPGTAGTTSTTATAGTTNTTTAVTTTTASTTTTTSTSTTTTTAASTTTTTAASTTTTAQPALRVRLVTSTTTPPVSTTAADSVGAPTTEAPAAPVTSPAVTTTSLAGATLAASTVGQSSRDIAQERYVLSTDLAQTIANEQQIKAQGVPTAAYSVLGAAQGSQASLLPGGAPLLVHRSVRGSLGLLAGLLIGIALAYLADGFDRRLRTVSRSSEAFGLPVIAEIPGEASASSRYKGRIQPMVNAVVDPFSPAAEAYRQVHVALRTAPAVAWIRRGSLPAASSADAGVPVPPAHRFGAGPPAEEPTRPPSSRFAVLITSPGDEPTRSLVVANLAAVFAETGDRVLVATVSGLRSRQSAGDRQRLPGQPLSPEPDVADIIAHARPSQLPGVSSLPLGQVIHGPAQLALRAESLVAAAREVVDVLLLEAPLVTTQDGEALLGAVDAVVVVSQCWYTTVSDGVRAQRLLARHRPSVLGLLMTNVPPPQPPLVQRLSDRVREMLYASGLSRPVQTGTYTAPPGPGPTGRYAAPPPPVMSPTYRSSEDPVGSDVGDRYPSGS